VGGPPPSLFVLGSFYLNPQGDPKEDAQRFARKAPADKFKEFALPNTPSIDDVIYEPASIKPEKVEAPAQQPIAEAVASPSSVTEFEADIILPDDQATSTDQEFVPGNVTDEFRSSTLNLTTDALQVDNFEPDSEDLRYEYFDGKLALYGNFGNSPYQILEINQNGEKRLFLFHETSFYAITNTSVALPLERIEDAEMIEELEIFKNEK